MWVPILNSPYGSDIITLAGFWGLTAVQYLQHNKTFWKQSASSGDSLKGTCTVGSIRQKCQLNDVWSSFEFQLCRLFSTTFSLKCFVLFEKLDHKYSTKFGISKFFRNSGLTEQKAHTVPNTPNNQQIPPPALGYTAMHFLSPPWPLSSINI